jgi:hypothetical protein
MEQDMQAKCNAQTAFKRRLMYQGMLSSKAACANDYDTAGSALLPSANAVNHAQCCNLPPIRVVDVVS